MKQKHYCTISVIAVVLGAMLYIENYPVKHYSILTELAGANVGSMSSVVRVLDNWMTQKDLEHKERKHLMMERCRSSPKSDKKVSRKAMLHRLMYNDEYKIMYCGIPKIASSSIKSLFLYLDHKPLNTSKPRVHMRHKYDYLVDQPAHKVKAVLTSYMKVIFIREPLERILSAYKNKLTNSTGHIAFKSIAKRIVERHRKTGDSSSDKIVPNFAEFIDHIIHTDMKDNIHWTRYGSLCHPCDINYDVIGRYETFSDDINYLMNKLNITGYTFPKRNQDNTLKTSNVLYQYYNTVPKEHLYKLWLMVKDEYYLYNYSNPAVITNMIE